MLRSENRISEPIALPSHTKEPLPLATSLRKLLLHIGQVSCQGALGGEAPLAVHPAWPLGGKRRPQNHLHLLV